MSFPIYYIPNGVQNDITYHYSFSNVVEMSSKRVRNRVFRNGGICGMCELILFYSAYRFAFCK